MRIHFINDMERNTWKPKLGLGYLSSFIKKYLPGTETTISFPEDDIIKNIETIKPDLIGLTSTSTTYKKISELSFYLKEKFPDVPQIMGGPHLSLLPEDLPVSVDLGVSCEGEETLLEVLRFFAKENKMPQGEINGTIYRKNGQILLAPSRKPIENLDTIPHPDLDLLQVEKRKPEWGSLYVMTSRGCPYRCSFCASIKLWSRIRYFSVEYVVEELEILVEKYRQKMIVIYDDLFIMNKKRIAAIGDLIRKKGLHKKVEFECNGRVDVLDEEVARELRRMNVTQISFGMESGSEQILKYLKNKTITLDQVRKAVKIAKNAGIEVGGTFMIGTPGETEEDIRKTIDFIREL
ncbi:MAG: radical SAM protein, partial [Elusimicrobiota bacterium]